ncbi:MAG: RHS repeat protein, partial [Gammaproteobacteria bacterium]|nr:RHS repeat protein [Gammaproteobacteria bacterium]
MLHHEMRPFYDRLNRLITTTNALSGMTVISYDALGNRLSLTDANGHTTTFAYDSL